MMCSIDECLRPSKARGFCNTHYERWRKHGDPMAHPRPVRNACSMPDCDKPAQARSLCKSHWYRWRANGDPAVTQRQYGLKRRVGSNGYVYIYEPIHPLAQSNGYVPEHRKVMHDLGHVIDGLHVHHVDHDKTNNDPSNLVVMTHQEHASLHGAERLKSRIPAAVPR